MPKRDLSPARPGQVTHGAGEIPITKNSGTGQHQHVVKVDEALPADKPANGRRLGQLLVSEGLISEDQLARALAAQRTSFRRTSPAGTWSCPWAARTATSRSP